MDKCITEGCNEECASDKNTKCIECIWDDICDDGY